MGHARGLGQRCKVRRSRRRAGPASARGPVLRRHHLEGCRRLDGRRRIVGFGVRSRGDLAPPHSTCHRSGSLPIARSRLGPRAPVAVEDLETGDGQVDPAARRVDGLHHEGADLAPLQQVTGTAGRRIAHELQRQVAANTADLNEGAMAGEGQHLSLHLLARSMLGDELDEGEGIVHRLRRGRRCSTARGAVWLPLGLDCSRGGGNRGWCGLGRPHRLTSSRSRRRLGGHRGRARGRGRQDPPRPT